MLDTFSTRITEWQTFYATAAGAAATFAGLLFVSVSLHPEVFRTPRYANVVRLAGHTYGTFVYVVVFALTFLVPRASPITVGVPVLVMGLRPWRSWVSCCAAGMPALCMSRSRW